MGCLIFIFFLLGFVHWGFWAVAFFLLVIAGISQSASPSPTTTNSPSGNTSSPGVPDDIDNILIDISSGEIKDPVTQETFRPGERIHLCLVHRLAYHEDSWREMECKCTVCGNNSHTKAYTLPVPIDIPKKDVSELIEFRDIE